MKAGVVVFPGSNCDWDTYYALESTGFEPIFLWHKDKNLDGCDLVVLPGGFSYGDYLRSGILASLSPIMDSIKDFVEKGGLVLGICNGFQILLESDLLRGAMLRNKNLRFVCKYVYLRVENSFTPFTNLFREGEVIKIPIAHMDGNYYIPENELEKMKENHQIVFRYCEKNGRITNESNPNGSMENIAGIINEKGNVLGMMPHPERASFPILGSEDGRKLFLSCLEFLKGKK
ncbi:MAG: phosphoribosylformylglycinamidine synthase I [Candidatus Aminicenantia bacterium]